VNFNTNIIYTENKIVKNKYIDVRLIFYLGVLTVIHC
jgi:hypothetical protein